MLRALSLLHPNKDSAVAEILLSTKNIVKTFENAPSTLLSQREKSKRSIIALHPAEYQRYTQKNSSPYFTETV